MSRSSRIGIGKKLKISRCLHHVGSTPTSCTIYMIKEKKCKRCPQNATFGVNLGMDESIYLCGNCLYHAMRDEEVLRYWNIPDEKPSKNATMQK